MTDNPDLSDERLRQVASYSASKWAADAAKEILRLREEVERLTSILDDTCKATGVSGVTLYINGKEVTT